MRIFVTILLVISIIEHTVNTVNIRNERYVEPVITFNIFIIIVNVVFIVLSWVG